MSHLPLPIIAFFLLTTLLALWLFGKAVRGSKTRLSCRTCECASSQRLLYLAFIPSPTLFHPASCW